MREEDPYGTYCAIASDLKRAINVLSQECKVPRDVIRDDLHKIIEKCLLKSQ